MSDSVEIVVIVHGLWMHPIMMYPLGRYLTQYGFDTKQFYYPSIRYSIADNAKRLHTFLRSINNHTIHFVGHSLGGLVIRQLFHDFSIQQAGRIVTLGTPHQGSQVAKTAARFTPGRLLLGKSIQAGLLGDIPDWQGQRQLGNLVGTAPLGLGRWITPLPLPNDGTVSIEECQLANATDYLALSVSHTHMLFSQQVAEQVAIFLRKGYFQHEM